MESNFAHPALMLLDQSMADLMTRTHLTIPLQPASYDIWDKKYCLKTKEGQSIDRDMDGTYRRIANTLAACEANPELQELWYDKFLWALRQGAIPAGRIISNAGAWDYKPATSTINCTVSGTIEDSMDDILHKVHEAGLTLKSGAGIGYCFSTLRPKGAYVSGAGAYTSGPLSFMDIYDKMCFTISSAGGRRGAQMATFDIHHPDVIEFIRAKREDARLRQFNLSLLITKDFMTAVQHDQEWLLSFPLRTKEVEEDGIDLNNPTQVIWREWPTHNGLVTNELGQVACKIYRTLKARRLWDLIMTSTYDYAEPGFILIDAVNELNNNWWCEYIQASNPCVTADTWVHTDAGPYQVSELMNRSFLARVDGNNHLSGSTGFFRTATKPVIRLKTVEGYTLRLTRNHQVRRVKHLSPDLMETEWCTAGELNPGDKLLLNNHRSHSNWEGSHTFEEGYLMGLWIGDGVLKQEAAIMSVWTRSQAANGDIIADGDPVIMMEIQGRHEFHRSLAAFKTLAETLGMKPGYKTITPAMERASSQFYRGFLRGLFDTDGSVQGNQTKDIRIGLAQSDLDQLQVVQRMLLRLGIVSRIYAHRRTTGNRRLPDNKAGYKEYSVSRQHELVVSGDNLSYFAERIGFADSNKHSKLQHAISNYKRAFNRERFTATVLEAVNDGVEDVFDVQIPGINTFDANGFHAHNCGEQMLPPYGSCLLGSINLTQFVCQPFTEQAYFDWPRYREVIAIFTRMLDNVVEINGLPLTQQQHELVFKRRHGMGYLGLGSTVTMLRMKYGEPDSLAFTEQVTRELALVGWRTGLELAQEKGPAPIMEHPFTVTRHMLHQRPEMVRDGVREGDTVKGKVLHAKYSRYMQRIATVDPELVDKLAHTGARFTHHTSIAPTGTIALSIANNASNGIEPSFAHHYARNVIRPGRKTKEKVDVYSYELLAYRTLIDPDATPNNLPDYFITSDTVTPHQHIDIQSAAQYWVDSSISKTANVPTDFPYENFKDIYRYAYEKGLKGCTTFRFNPQAFQGVLVKEQDLEKTIYQFMLEDGSVIEVKGNEEIEYDGETHTAANLFDALKEGYYGKW